MALVIDREDPGSPDVVALLEAHLSLMRSVSPAGHVHALDIDGLRDPAIMFFAARDDAALLGVGALRTLGDGHGEVKSMHTSAAARGRGVGRRLAEHLITLASDLGWTRLSLETGTMDAFEPARALYESLGFGVCEPFGSYTSNEFSVCMTLNLAPEQERPV